VRAVITAKLFVCNSIGCSFYLISSQVHSTALPSLRVACNRQQNHHK
jgi:hypothetical protein